MVFRIEVREKSGIYDAVGGGVKKDILELGVKSVTDVEFIQVFIIEGEVTKKKVERIAKDLLHDPVTQDFLVNSTFVKHDTKNCHVVEVAFNPGVMDPVEESALKGVRDLGIKGVESIRTAKKFIIRGNISVSSVKGICDKLLYNKVISHMTFGQSEAHKNIPPYQFRLITVPIVTAGDDELMKLSKEGQLFLNISEMRAIRDYFKKIGRNPTDCELESIAQTWSEHCKHKTLMGDVVYNGKTINNLLKNTIVKATNELNKKWCLSVFKDNSGVIEFDDKNAVCIKVETHNHPSALEPYGGSGTGIGGVIRDTMGTGIGAKPIMNTDVFCFGAPDTPLSKVPKGTLHPKRVMKGVVSGVRDYGNRMGIPTANGAILFDESYIGNPLVYCGNVGIMPKSAVNKKVDTGDLIVVVGGRTGRDGIHGATFSSGELTEESETVSGQAVQIGNAITEKKIVETLLLARDLGLFKAVTDCGAGGLSSAIGEMGEETGAVVDLDKVPLKYDGLTYTEIWISEAQERMVLACHPSKIKQLLKVFEDENVEATVIGEFTHGGRLELLYNGETVADIDMEFLHHGLPRIKRKAVWKKNKFPEPRVKDPKDLSKYLLKILSSWNVASKEWVIRQYDHEVQGGSVLKPLQGATCDGPGDAAVMRPILSSKKGIAVSNGLNPLYARIDPYWMAASSIDEALRQIVSVGCKLDRVAILDNYCWGNADKPDVLGTLVRASEACYDIAKIYGTPFISGKDSLNNEFKTKDGTISILPTLLITAMGVMDDVTKAVSMDFKGTGSYIYVVGPTYDELGASHYWKQLGFIGNSVPEVRAAKAIKWMRKLTDAMDKGLVKACHDCSEGGIGVAVAEMAFAGGIGADIGLKHVVQGEKIKRNDTLLFSESNSRFIVEVSYTDKEKFEKAMKGMPVAVIGQTKDSGKLRVEGLDSTIVLESSLQDMKKAWQKPFSNW